MPVLFWASVNRNPRTATPERRISRLDQVAGLQPKTSPNAHTRHVVRLASHCAVVPARRFHQTSTSPPPTANGQPAMTRTMSGSSLFVLASPGLPSFTTAVHPVVGHSSHSSCRQSNHPRTAIKSLFAYLHLRSSVLSPRIIYNQRAPFIYVGTILQTILSSNIHPNDKALHKHEQSQRQPPNTHPYPMKPQDLGTTP